ncbi:MAG: response regulator transcription factor [Roseburia sp.]|nr:response regulator transcription factor [Roseburia sp.]
MEKNIVIYKNVTGTAQKLGKLCAGDGIYIRLVDSRETLLAQLGSANLQLILLDIELEEQGWGNGVRLIADIRSRSSMPVIVVSGQSAESAKISALNAGADDYVCADCNPLELLARIRSQLRRYTQLANLCDNISQIYKVDGLEIDDTQRKVMVDGREVKLTPIEYKILRLLVKESGKALPISQIYESIWHMRAVGADNVIAVHIRHIREKIERDPKQPYYLKVVWGTGYKVG